MEVMRVAACDDDEAALGIISNSLQGIFTTRGIDADVRLFSRMRDLAEAMTKTKFDFLLLDIDMPDVDGITFAKALREHGDNVDIMYISSREDKVFESLRVSPVGFVRKSRFLDDMSEIVNEYLDERIKRHQLSSVVLRDSNLVRPIRVASIAYIEGKSKNQEIHLVGGKTITIRSSMKVLESQLAEAGFIRIHQGYLVNYRQIELIADQEVLLVSGESLPVSRRKLAQVRAAYLGLVQNNNLVF